MEQDLKDVLHQCGLTETRGSDSSPQTYHHISLVNSRDAKQNQLMLA